MTTLDQPDDLVPREAREAIQEWYAENGRQLAFRASADPYAVLLSEVLAQQTQAARAADAWTAWMARFPTVEALAAAPVADVVRAWAGLGYNRRAIHLHRAARVIVAEHGGAVPNTVSGLQSLPGVGPYTARAVAAIAFGLPVGAVDTNVRRVLGRVAAGGAEGLSPAALQALADDAVPRDRPGDWTHAVMDLGAGRCRPRAPLCGDCPATPWCRYAAGERPVVMPGRRRSRPEPPFETTTRWLRGRILARARDADRDAWARLEDPIGGHGTAAIHGAVTALTEEGLLEARATRDGVEVRLPRS